ncbi:hypothetical protein GCM10022384_01050 [Streptomyces marokkonensis]|uniref:Uncharacterized protein n=1 Tax=Streptomyces marokkonensis TaxID=324855 RepID=A0ABP7NPS7_9ACTN
METVAVTGDSPVASRTGKVISVPEPTTLLIAPAPKPAANTAAIASGVTRCRPAPAPGPGGRCPVHLSRGRLYPPFMGRRESVPNRSRMATS